MRIVEGLRGRVPMQMELSLRPDYESIRPWVEPADRVTDSAGPNAFRLRTPLPLRVEDESVKGEFAAVVGARAARHFSYEAAPSVEDGDSALARREGVEWALPVPGRVSRRGGGLVDRPQGDDL
jgi:hypothetical protein